jgi:hypothetical protein
MPRRCSAVRLNTLQRDGFRSVGPQPRLLGFVKLLLLNTPSRTRPLRSSDASPSSKMIDSGAVRPFGKLPRGTTTTPRRFCRSNAFTSTHEMREAWIAEVDQADHEPAALGGTVDVAAPALQGFNQPTPILSISRQFSPVATGPKSCRPGWTPSRTCRPHARPRRRQGLALTEGSCSRHARASRTREVGAQRRALYDAVGERENGPRDGREHARDLIGSRPHRGPDFPGRWRHARRHGYRHAGRERPTTGRSGDRWERATGSFTPYSPILWVIGALTRGTAESAVQPRPARAPAAFPPWETRLPRPGADASRPVRCRREASSRANGRGTTCAAAGCPPSRPPIARPLPLPTMGARSRPLICLK